MTSILMPRLFTARNGEILFEGRGVSVGRVIDVREFALRQAMNLKASPRTIWCWEAIYDSARTAIEEARAQRRRSLRLISDNPPPPRAA